ncbi:hypothetical protein [Anaeromyxobacter terrae]|uniref:hypothetical protein n=1 Tax=Anaeromyxobacter terrae TaxID=2925406 RepID=UPI001F571C21|nr:hypothetical protein [Anaeromyxobacter sp. SG22]
MPARSVTLLLAALAGPPALAQDAPSKPTGEVRFHASGGLGSGATFDQDRIVGPTVNLTHSDRGWAGNIAGQDVSLAGSKSKLSGPNVNLSFKQKSGKTEVEGLFYGSRVRLSVDGRKLKGRYGTCTFDLTRDGPPMYSGNVGCIRGDERRKDPWERPEPVVDELHPRRLQIDSNESRSSPLSGTVAVELIGEAARDTPPAAQLGLALVAILPH